jgi:hypothetical protein
MTDFYWEPSYPDNHPINTLKEVLIILEKIIPKAKEFCSVVIVPGGCVVCVILELSEEEYEDTTTTQNKINKLKIEIEEQILIYHLNLINPSSCLPFKTFVYPIIKDQTEFKFSLPCRYFDYEKALVTCEDKVTKFYICIDPFSHFLSMQNKLLAEHVNAISYNLFLFFMNNSYSLLKEHSFRPILNKPFKWFKMGFQKRSFKDLQIFDDTGKMISFVDPEKPEKAKKPKKAKKKS